MPTYLILLLGVLVWVANPVLAAGLLPAVPGSPGLACNTAQLAPLANTVFTSARAIANPVPYCRIDGYVNTDDPGPNTVGFMLALPETWSGRFLMVIPGGGAGYIVDPSAEHLRAGYAVATTDKGSHATSMLDLSYRAVPARNRDYAYRGVHVTAEATQQLARQYYRRVSFPRYMMGCSGGGLSTLTAAERFPADADAFIPSGMPTNGFVQSFWAYLIQSVAKQPERWISPALMARTAERIMATYDAADGASDGLIRDPRVVRLSAGLLPFLSEAQLGLLQDIAAGLEDPAASEELLAPGFWMSNPAVLGPVLLGSAPPPWDEQTAPRFLVAVETTYKAAYGADFDFIESADYSDSAWLARERTLWKSLEAYDIDTRRLSALKDSGGKLLLWTGAADDAIPPAYLTGYADEVQARFAGEHEAFFRAFLVPGMYHCRGGVNQPADATSQLLEAAQRWIEQGEAPGEVILSNVPRTIEPMTTSNTSAFTSGMSATNEVQPAGSKGRAERTYRLCAYPTAARFQAGASGQNPLDHRHWRCDTNVPSGPESQAVGRDSP